MSDHARPALDHRPRVGDVICGRLALAVPAGRVVAGLAVTGSGSSLIDGSDSYRLDP